MKIEKQDLTDYVLGELPEDERSRIENQLAESEELRRELQEIREAVAGVEEFFAAEAAAGLAEEQRSRISEAGHGGRSWRRYYPLAAGVFLALLVGVVYQAGFRGTDWTEPDAPILDSSSPAVPTSRDAARESAPAASNQDQQEYRTQAPEVQADAVEADPEAADTLRQAAPRSPSGSPDAAGDQSPSTATGANADARIAGTVVDPSGAGIPGAEVEVRQAVTGRSETTVTNERGRFEFNELSAGRYDIVTRLPGFKTDERRVALGSRQDLDVTATLQVGELSELVTLQRGSPMPPIAEMANSLAEYQIQTGHVGRAVAGGVPGGVIGGVLPFDRPSDFGAPHPDFNTEQYDRIDENPFIRVSERPLSTFSIDVDTASYSNVRRFLTQRMLPPKDAVRIEEMINYFPYDYPQPTGEHPFSVNLEMAQSPWNPAFQLVRIGLKGKEIEMSQRPGGNYVFLIDVSGSMQPPNKLPLLKQALRLLVENLDERDRVAIVVYAGASGLVLPSTSCGEKATILAALDRLEAGGSTNGGAGIELAYRQAEGHFVDGGINRVILATDGDFNVGVSDRGSLTRMIEEKARTGVFLTVLGFGEGNYQDAQLEALADRGNGNYAYIDSLREAKKILVEQVGGTLVAIAKDVKIQVEFNPAEVGAYRLIGYENRLLRDQDFKDDTKDAGEIGSGHTVTVLYELAPPGTDTGIPEIDPLKYQVPTQESNVAPGEILTVRLRYKQPERSESRPLEVPLQRSHRSFEEASPSFRFAAAVATFGMVLRDSEFRGKADLDDVVRWASQSLERDSQGYRAEFIRLVQAAKALRDLEALER
jgi:Ca-activated chloride channel homolog